MLNLDEETIEHHAVQLIEPQLAWHKSLTSRFKSYRSHLKPAVSESVLSAFDTVSNPIATDFGHPSSAGALQWKLILRTTIPKPTQLALMDQDTVRWLLELIPYVARRARWLKEDGKQGRCISAWIWGLLARLDELDTLSSEEVSVVRDLGKHAGGIIFGLDDQGSDEEQPVASNIQDKTPKAKPTGTARSSKLRRNSSSDEEEDVGEVEAVEEDEKSLVTPEPRHQVGEGHATNDIDDMPFTACTKEEALSGTLDMMLTIIGECYGQRDLLVARDKLWTIQGTQY